MDVLNTTGGGSSLALLILIPAFALMFAGGFALYYVWDALKEGMWGFAILFAVLCTFAFSAGAILCGEATEKSPIRHEVTLRPGYVIDAEKYEIVEQRGKIYVIEEREAAE